MSNHTWLVQFSHIRYDNIPKILTIGLLAIMPVAARATAPHHAAGAVAYAPVCNNGEYLGDVGLSPPGQEWQTRRIYYCPQGASVIQLMFAGAYAGGPNTSFPIERNLVDPQEMKLSIETYVPPVWLPTVSYTAGDVVSGPVAANDPAAAFVALASNRNNPPSAMGNAAWRHMATQSIPYPVAITCNGTRPCILGTHVEAGGRTVADAFLVTDLLRVNIPPRSLIALRGWIHQSGTQVMAVGPSQSPRAGSYEGHGTTEPDITLSGTRLPGAPEHNTGPFAVVGLQNVASPKPSVCIVGDSRAGGVSGLGLNYAPIVNGGSRYVASDIGHLVANVDTGGTSDSALESASYVIQNVTGGAVSQIAVYNPGHYAVPKPSRLAGVASEPPTGPQPTRPLTATAGSGLIVSITPNNVSPIAGFSEDPKTFAQGFIQKGLSDAGLTFASFSRAGDRAMTWAAPGGDTNRLAAIAKTGCTSVIMQYGINDIHAGRTAAQIEADLTTVAHQLLALGTVKGVYLATIQPQTNSTDHWTSAANQTPVVSYEPARHAVNAWERSGPRPFAGAFDVAAPVEVDRANVLTRDGGAWIANGQPHFATPDGVHLSPAIAAIAAGVITANAAMLK